MCKPMGRSDDMLIVKGVNVFPSQIETVLLNKGYPANYQIIVTRVKNSDNLEVQVEMTPEMFFRISRSCIVSMKAIESIIKQAGSRLRIVATPEPGFEMTVSRSRVDDFLKWLER